MNYLWKIIGVVLIIPMIILGLLSMLFKLIGGFFEEVFEYIDVFLDKKINFYK